MIHAALHFGDAVQCIAEVQLQRVESRVWRARIADPAAAKEANLTYGCMIWAWGGHTF
jgi:hypothetical protein